MSAAAVPEEDPSGPVARGYELLEAAEEAAQSQLFERQAEQLRLLLEHVKENMEAFASEPSRAGEVLDRAAVGFYRLSLGEAALEAADLSLRFEPDRPSALQHKAIILFSMNRDPDQVLQLLDRALNLAPQDKSIWASKGDALKVLNRPAEAVEAYLRAQALDPTTSTFVDRALKIAPNHPKALRMKLAIALSSGATDVALLVCEQLLRSAPTDPELNYTKAQILVGRGDLAGAREFVERALGAAPHEPRYQLLRAEVLWKGGQREESLAIYRDLLARKVPVEAATLQTILDAFTRESVDEETLLAVRNRWREVDPRNLANLQETVRLALRMDRKDIALEACRSWMTLSPGNLDAARTFAEVAAESGQVDLALRAYHDLIQQHPQEQEELRKALRLALAARKPAQVIHFARALLTLKPEDEEVQEELASALTETGQREEALKIVEGLLSRHPHHVGYLLRRKALLQALGRVEEIPQILDLIFEIDPSQYDVALERGNLCLSRAFRSPEKSEERTRWATEALRSYERSSVSDGLRAPSALGIGRAARLIGDPARAIDGYRKFLQDPANGARADIYKELGHALREVGQSSSAEEAYQRAVELGLEDPDLLWGLVEVLTSLGQEARALRYLEALLQREPQNPLYLRRKGRLLIRLGRRPEGIQALRSALSSRERDPQAYFEVADALKDQGNYQDALAYYQRGLQLDPKDRAGLLAYSETLILAGRFNEAVGFLESLLRQDSHDARAWRLRAQAYRSLQRDSEVLYSLRALLLLEPENPGIWKEKLALHLARGEKPEAYECLTALVKLPAPDPAVRARHWIELGDLAAEMGRQDEALRAYEEALRADPSVGPEIQLRRASTLAQDQKYAEALEALAGFPEGSAEAGIPLDLSRRVKVLKGSCLFYLKRYPEAREIFGALVKDNPQDRTGAIWYVRTLLHTGDYSSARDFLRQVLPDLTEIPLAYLYLAEAEAGLGALDLATEVCRQGLKVHPESVTLLTRWGDLEWRQEHWKEAAEAYSRAAAIEPKNAEHFARAGAARERLGHNHEALSAYSQACQLSPRNKDYHASRGRVLLTLDQPEKATEAFDEALKLDPTLEAAREGKKQAAEKAKELQIQTYGREALLLEARLNRPITKNDLFLTLHIPFELLDPVTKAMGRTPEIRVEELSEEDLRELENATFHVINSALEQKGSVLEKKGLTLADVATFAPTATNLGQIQRIFGYMRSVLRMEITPDRLRLTPDLEELARQALALPETERTLFGLVRNLRVGLYKARIIKVIESVGGSEAAVVPTLELSSEGSGAPETDRVPSPLAPPSEAVGEEPSSPSSLSVSTGETELESPVSEGRSEPSEEWPRELLAQGLSPAPEGLRCQSCGGVAQFLHRCGAKVCRSCVVQFKSCPRCSLSLTLPEKPAPRSAPRTAPGEKLPHSPGLERVRLPKPRDDARL